MESKPITVQTTVNAPIAKVWDRWNKPEHITGWAFDSDDWEVSDAENDLRAGGKFKIKTRTKDKSDSVDFIGTYTTVRVHKLIEYDLADGRHVKVVFDETPNGVKITETFDPENENSVEVQRDSWQGTLENFKRYTEKP